MRAFFLALIFIELQPPCQTKNHRKILEVLKKGVFPTQKGHIALTFYLGIRNRARESVQLTVAQYRCCFKQRMDEKNKDCESMQLLGGFSGVLRPMKFVNVTFVFPNRYVEDRKGWCYIDVFTEGRHLIRRPIHFTTVVERSAMENIYRGVVYGENYADCRGVDEDRLRGCAPVNCVEKYLGHKNFFNERTKTCEKVISCMDEGVIYDKLSNVCRNESVVLDRSTIRELEEISVWRDDGLIPQDPRKMRYIPCDYKWNDVEESWSPPFYRRLRLDPRHFIYKHCYSNTDWLIINYMIMLSTCGLCLFLTIVLVCLHLRKRLREKRLSEPTPMRKAAPKTKNIAADYSQPLWFKYS